MTLDQRARAAAVDVHDQLNPIPVPESGAVLRRARRRRGARVAAGVVGVAVVAAGGLGLSAAVPDSPDATPLAVGAGEPVTEGEWTRVPKEGAGLEPGSSFDAVASDGRSLVLAGARPAGDWWQAALWYSEDGLTWEEADHPAATGSAFSVGIHEGVALAIGTRGGREVLSGSNFVWRSEDGGRTWTEIASGPTLFGPPAPEMGRPFASQVVFRDGWWIATGGSSSGYAGIWVSRTGEEWEQVLESRFAGGTTVTDLSGDQLLAYWTDVTWRTDDPTEWGPHLDVEIASDLYPSSIASGASLAAGSSFEGPHTRTPLLRSDDEGRTWRVDESFADQFPGAFLVTAAQLDDLSVVTGADGESRPTAWMSVDGEMWQATPEELRGSPGGVLILVTSIDGRVVILGTAPELDRYYVFEP